MSISYLSDLNSSVQDRRRSLQSGWQFACACPRCQVEEALPQSTLDMIKTLQYELDPTSSQAGTIVAHYRQVALVITWLLFPCVEGNQFLEAHLA